MEQQQQVKNMQQQHILDIVKKKEDMLEKDMEYVLIYLI